MGIELWNGFCAGMSVDDVKNRGNELFGFDYSEETGFTTATEYHDYFPNEWFDDRVPQKWFSKIKPDTIITYGNDSLMVIPECIRDQKNAENEKIFEEKYKFVKMFFYENLLFALLINWSGDSEKVLEFAISKYGKYDKEISEVKNVPYHKKYEIPRHEICYCWDIKDKYMYIKGTIVFFIKKNFEEKE
jgi:hypothetical protein